jgi:carboxymethylenebutenolidase
MSDQIALHEETINLDRDGKKLPIFAVGPANNTKLPALILIHEIFGLDDHIRDVARRYARQSMRVFAPDLFAVCDQFPKEPEQRKDLQRMREVWMSIPDSQLLSDLENVFTTTTEYPGVLPHNVGVLGYCMGGAISFMFACSEPRIAWVVDYYGRIKYGDTTSTKPKHPIDYAANLKCPLLGIFAGKDELITAEHREALARVLEKGRKSFKIKVYDNAEHAFFNDQRPHYNKDAAEDAWKLTLDFIKSHSSIPHK